IRNREPCRREKRSDIATAAAVSAVVARWMIVVRDRQLCATIGQVRQADLLRPFLNDVVNAAERNWREVLAIGIARPILNGAGHPHVPLRLGKPGRNLCVVDGPVFANSVEIGGLEIDIAESGRGSSPEIGLAPRGLASLPVPIGAGSVGIRDVMLKEV